MNVRPDGYVGSVRKWRLVPSDKTRTPEDLGKEAAEWLDEYFGSFLAVP